MCRASARTRAVRPAGHRVRGITAGRLGSRGGGILKRHSTPLHCFAVGPTMAMTCALAYRRVSRAPQGGAGGQMPNAGGKLKLGSKTLAGGGSSLLTSTGPLLRTRLFIRWCDMWHDGDVGCGQRPRTIFSSHMTVRRLVAVQATSHPRWPQATGRKVT
jgi:hypothetical protein